MWRVLSELLDAVYPRACFLCGAASEDGVACELHRLPRGPDGPRCGRCSAPLPPALPHGSACAACRRGPPPFGCLVTLADYRASAEVREWILALKHRGRRDLARPLGAALAQLLASGPRAPAPGALLVPVPAHPLRRLERGYDQARLLALATGHALGRPVVRALVRTRFTGVQGAPGSSSRAANVRGAFRLEPDDRRRVRAREVWLVDDVVTSGATVGECARVLRRAGAARVHVACIARACRPA